jgi:hypothetical protein
MNDIIRILGERWTYVYSSIYYGIWSYNNETKELTTSNVVSFSKEEIQEKIEELETLAKQPECDPSVHTALTYMLKIKEKIN